MGYGHYIYTLDDTLSHKAKKSFQKETFGTDCNLLGDAIKDEIDGNFYIGKKNIRFIDSFDNYKRDPDTKGLFRNKFSKAIENHPELSLNRFYIVGEALNVFPHSKDATAVFNSMNIPLLASCTIEEILAGVLDVGFISESKSSYRSKAVSSDDSFIYHTYKRSLDDAIPKTKR